MMRRGALYLLMIALALLASSTIAPPAKAANTIVVDDDSPSCQGGPPNVATITQALASATNGDTIIVCAGNYPESSLIVDKSLTITGPGATTADDGVATVRHNGGSSAMFMITADNVTLEGLDLDATPPPGFFALTIGIESSNSHLTIQDNEIRNATSSAVSVGGVPPPSDVSILTNDVHDNDGGIGCFCDDSTLWNNTVDGVGSTALSLQGDRGTIADNVVADGTVSAIGNDLLVATNQVSAGTASSTMYVSGNPVTVSNNSLSDADYYGIEVSVGMASSTSVTVDRNVFTQIRVPIYLSDWDPSDALTVNATIGGSPSEANTFVNSGGTLGDVSYLLEMSGPTSNINAEHNKWGLCTAAEIEQEIYHQVDDPAQGLVDFEPFIAPDACPTPTPSPSPSPTATGTPMPPAPGQMHYCPEAGKWSIATWSGGDATPIADALAFCPQEVDAAYRIDPDTQAWARYFRGRPDISNLTTINGGEGVIALGGGVSAASAARDERLRAAANGMLGCPHEGKWAISVWTGTPGTPTGDALASCPGVSVDAAYWIDPATQEWRRYFNGRPDLSNLTVLDEMQGILTLGG